MAFTGSTTGFCIFEATAPKDFEPIHGNAFTDAIDGEGNRSGWVGLGNPLDTDFATGIAHGAFAAFSLRVDTRKAPGAAVNLQLAEAVQKELASGKKVSGKRRKELKEAIVATLTSKAEFVPSLTDCLWDLSRDRLLVSVSSVKAALSVLTCIKATFGFEPTPVVPKTDISALFARLFHEELQCDDWALAFLGSASLASPAQGEDKAAVTVLNNPGAVGTALNEGLGIQKLLLSASRDDMQLCFNLDAALAVSGLKLPKAEKGADADADFLLKADVCATVAMLVEKLAA